VDFEEKLMQALVFIFDCDICGCLYHFSECLNRKAQKLSLLTHENEEETRNLIKNLKNLCFSNNNLSEKLKELKLQYQVKLDQLSNLEQSASKYLNGLK